MNKFLLRIIVFLLSLKDCLLYSLCIVLLLYCGANFNIGTFRFTGETQPGLVSCKDAAKRLINLGLVFTPVEEAVRETVDSLLAKGFLKPQQMLQS